MTNEYKKAASAAKLKIKTISLADESRVIRKSEKRFFAESKSQMDTKHKIGNELHRHRIDVVRFESRATNIARAFLSGLKLSDVDNVETFRANDKLIKRVVKLIKNYGTLSGDVNTGEIVEKWSKI